MNRKSKLKARGEQMKLSKRSEQELVAWITYINWPTSHPSNMKIFHEFVKVLFEEHGMITSQTEVKNAMIPYIKKELNISSIDESTDKILDTYTDRIAYITHYLRDEKENFSIV